MIIMPVPKDIRDFKPKFIGPLTKPQFFGVAGAGIAASIIYALFGKILGRETLLAIMFVVATPFIACGFIQLKQLPLAIYFRDIWLRNFLAPSFRPYKTENSYQKLGEQTLITYEYFDPDFGYTTNKRGEKVKAKNRSKLSAAKLEEYLKEHPEMRGIE